MEELLEEFTSHALHIVEEGDLLDLAALFFVATFTEFGIPFPLVIDSTLFLLGSQITGLWFKAIIVFFVLVAGRELGASVVYWISHFVGSPLVARIDRRFPSIRLRLDWLIRTLRLKPTLAIAVSRLAAQPPGTGTNLAMRLRPPMTVAVARLTPGLLSVTSVAAGILGLRYRNFIEGTGISALIDDGATIGLGAITGYGLRELNIINSSWFMIVGVAVDIIVVLLIQSIIWRRKPANASPTDI